MKIITFTCLSLLFFSCAQNKLKVTSSEVVPYDEFSLETRLDTKTKSIKIAQVQDARGEQTNHIGVGLTGVRYERTPLKVDTTVALFFKNYLTNALKKRSVNVDNENGEIEFNVVISKLWVRELIEKHKPELAICEAEVHLNAEYMSSQFTAKYWNEITSPGDMGGGTAKLKPTLASCMNFIVEKIVKDQKFIDYIKE